MSCDSRSLSHESYSLQHLKQPTNPLHRIHLRPSAWHGPEAFAPTTTILTAAGYTVHGVNLPSVGPVKHLQSFDPDVVEICNTINSVLSKGKDVVMLYHSYGGVPGSEALGGYIKYLESGKGKEGWGRVRRLVYCASFVLPEGGSLMAALQGKPLPWFILDVVCFPLPQLYPKIPTFPLTQQIYCRVKTARRSPPRKPRPSILQRHGPRERSALHRGSKIPLLPHLLLSTNCHAM
jgi:hypothetical protein